MKQTRSLSEFTWCPKLPDFTLSTNVSWTGPNMYISQCMRLWNSVYFDFKFNKQGFENACWHRETCRDIKNTRWVWARLWEHLLTSWGLPSNSTCILKAEPGKLDIKRRKPGILFISGYQILRCLTAGWLWKTSAQGRESKLMEFHTIAFCMGVSRGGVFFKKS